MGASRCCAARLMEDEVQGDQEGALHGEDGDAGDDGDEPRHARFFAGVAGSAEGDVSHSGATRCDVRMKRR